MKTLLCLINPHPYALQFFNNDMDKVRLWYETKNPMLGNVSPIEMIILGRGDRLDKFINNAKILNGHG